jgi:hypothetical protein
MPSVNYYVVHTGLAKERASPSAFTIKKILVRDVKRK